MGQTDSTPCVAGGTGMNLCDMANKGIRTIALSQDLVTWAGGKHFNAGDKVNLVSNEDWRCNGEFIVADALNARFRNRGDIFMMDRKDNISCRATITKI